MKTRSRPKGAVYNTAPYNTFAFNECRVERWIIWEDGNTLEVVKFARRVDRGAPQVAPQCRSEGFRAGERRPPGR